jgi:hypothetical protein
MPECRCPTEAAATGRNADAGLTFSSIPAFRHLLMTEDVSWFSSSLDCSARSTLLGCLAVNRIDKGGFFSIFSFYVRYSTLRHLPPLRFHCVGGCWDQTQDCCDFGIDSQML